MLDKASTTISTLTEEVGLFIASKVKLKNLNLGVTLNTARPPQEVPDGVSESCWGVSHHPTYSFGGTLYPWSVWVFVINEKQAIREVLLLEADDPICAEVSSFMGRLRVLYPTLETIRRGRKKKVVSTVTATEEPIEIGDESVGETVEEEVAYASNCG